MICLPSCRALSSLALLCGFLLALSAALATDSWECDRQQRNCHSVFVVRNSWHAGIVLHKSNVTEKILPELSDLPDAEMIEFSWGDQDYFPDPKAGVYEALRAAFWSSGSVIHLVGFTGTVENFYRGADITELLLSKNAFERLLLFLAGAFARTDPPVPAKPRPGLFANSRFYSATGKFSIARTCNTWVAEALNFAGLPINSASVITAGHLNSQIDNLTVRK